MSVASLSIYDSWLRVILPLSFLISRGSIGIYVGREAFRKEQRNIYLSDWFLSLFYSGVFLAFSSVITLIVFPNLRSSFLLTFGIVMFIALGLDILGSLVSFLDFLSGGLFVGEGGFPFPMLIIGISAIISLVFPFLTFYLGVFLAKRESRQKLPYSEKN
ncbi:MAG: hypothetical protein ACXABG_15535 [Promethearchaeota archaeon]|jgi:hypothetical protein